MPRNILGRVSEWHILNFVPEGELGMNDNTKSLIRSSELFENKCNLPRSQVNI
jgi:hypothetical protein